MKKLKIALIKQVTLPDLYVCKKNADINEVLFSSMMRVGPIGLFEEFDCDFYIVDVDNSKECGLWKKINRTPLNGTVEHLLDLKTKTLNQLPGQEFKVPGSRRPNGDFAIPVDNIEWKDYNIIISINISVPTRILRKYPKILWCYMLMEPQIYMDKVYFDYDVSFNHHISGLAYDKPGIIDFPFTFVQPGFLTSILKKELGRESHKKGIFCDVSCSKKQPEEKLVKEIPDFLLPLSHTGHKLLKHEQNIKENLINLFDSKYFIKIGGSYIRGNSIIEAISAGTLVIGDPDKIIMKNLLPAKCRVKTIDEATKLINELEANHENYKSLWYQQQGMAQFLVIEKPMESLLNIFMYKKKYGKLKKTLKSKIYKMLKNLLR